MLMPKVNLLILSKEFSEQLELFIAARSSSCAAAYSLVDIIDSQQPKSTVDPSGSPS